MERRRSSNHSFIFHQEVQNECLSIVRCFSKLVSFLQNNLFLIEILQISHRLAFMFVIRNVGEVEVAGEGGCYFPVEDNSAIRVDVGDFRRIRETISFRVIYLRQPNLIPIPRHINPRIFQILWKPIIILISKSGIDPRSVLELIHGQMHLSF